MQTHFRATLLHAVAMATACLSGCERERPASMEQITSRSDALPIDAATTPGTSATDAPSSQSRRYVAGPLDPLRQVDSSSVGTVPPDPPVELFEDNPLDLEATLLSAARNYRAWTRASDWASWSPTLCTDANPEETILASRSLDGSTHGRKLYYLYVRDASTYLASGPEIPLARRATNPVGQVLVKEGWHPVEHPSVGPTANSQWSVPEGVDPRHIAMLGDRFYVRGDQADLYMMYRMATDTPGTDAGWVYAVVSPGPDQPRVLNSGMIESCVDCHRRAEHDRILGMWQSSAR